MTRTSWPLECIPAARAQLNWFNIASEADALLARWFEARGIDWRACEQHSSPLRLHPIFELGGGLFEIVARSRRALILAIYDERGYPQDLAAWFLDQPYQPMLYLGDGALLGADQVLNPDTYANGKPLQIRRNIVDWLRAKCAGVCILSATNAAPLLGRAPGLLAAQSERHGRQLIEALQPYVDASKIVVPAEQSEVA